MRNRWCVLWLWVVLVVGGCAGGGGSGDQGAVVAGGATAERRGLPGGADGVVDEVGLVRGWVDELTGPEMAGRGLGEPGLDVAEAWLVERMVEAGLEPGFVGKAGMYGEREAASGRATRGESGSWVQAFGARLRLRATTERMGLNGVELRAGEGFGTLGLSTNGGFDAGVVFVGYGIVDAERGYDSYAGMPAGLLEGRVAVAYRYEPMDGEGVSRWTERERRWTGGSSLLAKAEAAKARGAVGLIVVVPPGVEAERLRSVSATRPKDGGSVLPAVEVTRETWWLMLAEAGLGAAVDRAYRRLADRGQLVAEELPGVTVEGQLVLEAERVRAANVAGVVMGKGELAGEVVMVGAHYDHLGVVKGRRGGDGGRDAGSGDAATGYYPGADDNASGVAAMLVGARRYADWVSGLDGEAAERPRRTVVFVGFSAEERGLIGSTAMARRIDELSAWDRAGVGPAVLNVRRGGQAGTQPAVQSDGVAEGVGRVAAVVNLDMVGRVRRGRLLVYGVGSAEGWRARLGWANVLPGLRLVVGESPWGPSDHRPFYERGVPALHLFTGLTGDYHTVRDTADTLNIEGVARVGRLVGGLAAVLAWDGGGLAYRWVADRRGWQRVEGDDEDE